MGQSLWFMLIYQPAVRLNELMWAMALSSTLPPCHKMAAESKHRDFMLCSPFSRKTKEQLTLRAHGGRECQQMAISKSWSSMRPYGLQCFTKWTPLGSKFGGNNHWHWEGGWQHLSCRLVLHPGESTGSPLHTSNVVWCFSLTVVPPLLETSCVNWQCPVLWHSRDELPCYPLVVAKLNPVWAESCPKVQPPPGLVDQHRSLQVRQASATTALPSSFLPHM